MGSAVKSRTLYEPAWDDTDAWITVMPASEILCLRPHGQATKQNGSAVVRVTRLCRTGCCDVVTVAWGGRALPHAGLQSTVIKKQERL